MPTETLLRQYFLASLSEDVRPMYEAWPALERLLQETLLLGRESWPGVDLPVQDFAEYIAQRALCDDDRAALPAYAGDLYLAVACVNGDPAAIAHFENSILSKIDAILSRLGLAACDADDVRQDVRERLLVGARGKQPALERYLGTGALLHWVRAVASRQALASFRGKKPTVDIDEQIIEDASDPQLAELKRQHRDEFKDALHKAVAELGARERTILHALVVDDRSVADIAKLYKVHRVTASRWIAGIRKSLFVRTRSHLRSSLSLSEDELQSMIRMVESQMEMSLSRVLGDQG